MHRRPPVEEKAKGLPVSPVALGVALGGWVALMLVLAFVVVPLLFANCAPA